MELNQNLARIIVKQMMKKIPYNINMMNAEGKIIASGNPQRIGEIHIGAIQAMEEDEILPMSEYHNEHGQPGVNMPVKYQGKVIGVVGITGKPEEVVPLASLLKVATELLVNQLAKQEEIDDKRDKLNRFLFRWIQTTNDLATKQNLKIEAEQLQINLNIERYVIDFKTDTTTAKKIKLGFDDFLLSRADDTQVIITSKHKVVKSFANLAKQLNLHIGISNKNIDVSKAFHQAQIAVNLAQTFHLSSQYYSDILFIDKVLSSNLTFKNTQQKIHSLTTLDQGNDYLNTIFTYVKCNQIANQTAKKLHIHRNTLTYRLEKIRSITGLDPWNTEDLFQLYVEVLKFVDTYKEKIKK